MNRNIHSDSNVWSTAKERKIPMDLMFMSDINETIDQLAVANSVCWHTHILRALDFELKSQLEREAKEDMEISG